MRQMTGRIGRIVRPADFERVLAAPSRARSAHFAVHHLAVRPGPARPPADHSLSTRLSTSGGAALPPIVDEPQRGVWLGTVIPKRHARRAVTRSLLKRQIRAAIERQAALPGGMWVVRLRAPFAGFVSAASDALRDSARAELDAVLTDAARRPASG